jgi:hypothetical protein
MEQRPKATAAVARGPEIERKGSVTNGNNHREAVRRGVGNPPFSRRRVVVRILSVAIPSTLALVDLAALVRLRTKLRRRR